MLKDFEYAIEKELPKSNHDPFILALSGGIDSMTLFYMLKNLKRHFVVAHVNHKKRPESDHEYDALKNLCDDFAIPFEGAVFNDAEKGNFQKNARLFRQDFFKKTARKHGSKIILTAHHYDDLLETFLMRLLEGRTLSGLTSMKKTIKTDDGFTFVKPFLDFEKSQIVEYAKYWEIPYFRDESNDFDIYTRNRIRRTLIPMLEKENPNFKSTIRTTLEDIEDLNDFLELKVKSHPMFKENKLSMATFGTFQPAMKRRFLKRKFQTYIPSFHPSKKYLDELISQLQTSAHFSMPLNRDYTLHKAYDVFQIRQNAKNNNKKINTLITQQGTYPIDENHTLVVTDKKKADTLTKPYVLWYNDDVYPIIMRTRENGDTIEFPYGHKKISRLFIDRKIEPHKRDEMLLLTDTNKNVLWIPSLDIRKTGTTGKHCLYFYLITDNTHDQ